MKSKRASKAIQKELLEQITHADAAGIDVGAEELVVAVAPERDARSVRTFKAFTPSLHEMRDWLLQCGVKTAAMESTGNYWIAACMILEDAGIEVFLVNARHVKGVPGKKTDICDAQWLQQLHRAGLLKKSFRPQKEIAPLRYLMRHRAELVGDAAKQLQLMQKALTEMNLKLQHVLSDLDSVSGMAILEAILAGQRDPFALAALRDSRCKASVATVAAALQGDYRQEYLFVLGQCHKRWKELQQDLLEVDRQLAGMFGRLEGVTDQALPAPAAPRQHRALKNSPALPIFEQGWRFYGVDLSSIDGISSGLIAVMMSELGNGKQICQSFKSGSAFASWLGLCPDNRISGGKVLKAKTRHVVNRVATAFRQCAQALSHSKSALGDYCRRMKGRLGKAEGITAVAHKLVRIVFGMLLSKQPYDEKVAFRLTPIAQAKRLANFIKKAQSLGYQLVPLTSSI